MSLDIYFPENIARTILALSQANRRAVILARRYGADEQFISIAETAYQAALDDIAAAFGLGMTIITEVRNERPIDGETGHNRILSAAFRDSTRQPSPNGQGAD